MALNDRGSILICLFSNWKEGLAPINAGGPPYRIPHPLVQRSGRVQEV